MRNSQASHALVYAGAHLTLRHLLLKGYSHAKEASRKDTLKHPVLEPQEFKHMFLKVFWRFVGGFLDDLSGKTWRELLAAKLHRAMSWWEKRAEFAEKKRGEKQKSSALQKARNDQNLVAVEETKKKNKENQGRTEYSKLGDLKPPSCTCFGVPKS